MKNIDIHELIKENLKKLGYSFKEYGNKKCSFFFQEDNPLNIHILKNGVVIPNFYDFRFRCHTYFPLFQSEDKKFFYAVINNKLKKVKKEKVFQNEMTGKYECLYP